MTVMVAGPAVAMSAAEMLAASEVAAGECGRSIRAVPAHDRAVHEIAPVTVRVNPGPPAVAEPGFRLVIAGAGGGGGGGGLPVEPNSMLISLADAYPACPSSASRRTYEPLVGVNNTVFSLESSAQVPLATKVKFFRPHSYRC